MKRRLPLAALTGFAASLTAVASVWSGAWRPAEIAPVALVDAPPQPTPQPPASGAALGLIAAPDGEAAGSVAAPVSVEAELDAAPCTEGCRRHRSEFVGPADPRMQYAFDTGGPVVAMPAITPGGDVVVASLSGTMARLSPSGTPVWTVDLGDRIYSSPLVLADVLFVGCDNRRFVALSLATGKTRWVAHLEGEADTAPAETPDGSIVVAAGQYIYGLTRHGGIRFRIKAKKKVFASPAVAADGTIYVGSQDDHLYAIAPSGRILWQRDLGADIDCTAAIGNRGTIYAGTDAGRIFALDRNGTVRWATTVGGFVRGGLTVSRDGKVIAGTYGPEPGVVALDGDSGAVRFRFTIGGTGAAEFGIHGSPLEDAQGNLYFGAPDRTLYALDATGRLRWTFGAGGGFDAPVVVGPEGTLYAGSDDGHLYALR